MQQPRQTLAAAQVPGGEERRAAPSATGSAFAAKRNEIAASVAPIVWPVSRAVASMPPAAPLRSIGAEDSMVRLFGDWKKPKPRPQTAIRQAIAADDASAGSSASRTTKAQRREPRGSSAAEDRGGNAIGRTTGDCRGDAGRQRPWRHQQAGVDLIAMEHALEIERQRDEGEHLRRERRDRRHHRQREQLVPEQVDRHGKGVGCARRSASISATPAVISGQSDLDAAADATNRRRASTHRRQ